MKSGVFFYWYCWNSLHLREFFEVEIYLLLQESGCFKMTTASVQMIRQSVMFQGIIIDRLFARIEWNRHCRHYYIILNSYPKKNVETLDPWLGELEWQVNKLTSGVFVFFTALQVGQCPEEFGIITLLYNAVGCCWNEIDLSAKLKPSNFLLFCSHCYHWPLGQIQGETSCRLPNHNLIALPSLASA